ncbi:MAG: IS91 family transposase [Myxococcales bacterium]|nr:IS91 family transposase [Myxococcales bacterium]
MRQHGPCARSPEPAQEGRPSLELADVVRAFRPVHEQQHALTLAERAVLDAVARCRTAALGGHVNVCLDCGFVSDPSYDSCHNRHCPKCPAVAQAKWIAGRLERVLPIHYFHVVFTLPAQLRGLALASPRIVYDLLFRCASATLLQLGVDPKRCGGELGVTAVLHTWTQKLEYHPHLHCIVTGGALSPDGSRWISARRDFLFPVHVMGRLFRGKMLDALTRAARSGTLRIGDPTRFAALVAGLHRKSWNVYCKRPFGGAAQVITYLGQYTHRVAISNHRLLAMDQRGVTFRTKSGEHITLDGVAFLMRWLRHILPPGFTKIRHYGLVSASHATGRLETARQLLPAKSAPNPTASPSSSNPLRAAKWREVIRILTGIEIDCCRCCGRRALERRPLPRSAFDARAPPKAA